MHGMISGFQVEGLDRLLTLAVIAVVWFHRPIKNGRWASLTVSLLMLGALIGHMITGERWMQIAYMLMILILLAAIAWDEYRIKRRNREPKEGG